MKELICLPAFNEAESIRGMITEIQKLKFDFIVSDAGSTDDTVTIAMEMGAAILTRSAPGKGVGIREALQFARKNNYDTLITIDCDNTYPVDSIPQLAELAKSSELVLAARDYSKISLGRRMANHSHNLLFRIFFGRKLSDINTGLRAINVDSFCPLLVATGMDLEAEMCCKAVKHKLRISEIKIDYRTERTGDSKVRLSDFFLILFRIVREKWTK